MRYLLVFAISLFLLSACKKDPAAEVLGKWQVKSANSSNSSSIVMTFKEDKTWVDNLGTSGTWDLSGQTVSIAITKADGKPIKQYMADMMARAKQRPGANLAKLQEAIKRMEQNLNEKAILSADGKSMSIARANGTTMTLTKEAST